MEDIELTPVFADKYKHYVRVFIRERINGNQYEIVLPHPVMIEMKIEKGNRVQLFEDRNENLYIKKTVDGELVTLTNKTFRVYSKEIAIKLLGDGAAQNGKYLCEVIEIKGEKAISICNRINHIRNNGKH